MTRKSPPADLLAVLILLFAIGPAPRALRADDDEVLRARVLEAIHNGQQLLILSKGMTTVVINKLKFGERDARFGEVLGRDWNRHPRDISNLVDFTSTLDKWPRLLSWQIVDLRAAAMGEGVAALLQSPIQFISGADSPETIQGPELQLLKDYLAQGGFIFAVQNCENGKFDAGFRDLVRRLFEGKQELERLPPTHDVYRSEFVFPPDADPPELWGVDFGCRAAIIYAPYDHACRWNKWVPFDLPNRPPAAKTQIEKSMRLGVNVIAYVTGGELHDKLERPKVLAAAEQLKLGRDQVLIARLRHSGGWDTAPNALRHLQTALNAVDIFVSSETPIWLPPILRSWTIRSCTCTDGRTFSTATRNVINYTSFC